MPLGPVDRAEITIVIEPTVEAFAAAGVARVLPAQCTGSRAVHLLARAMPEAFVRPAVGTAVSF